MTGDIPAPALRLIETLPVRTHQRYYPADYAEYQSSGLKREVEVDGVRYESLAEAARKLGCAKETLRRSVNDGRPIPKTGNGRGGGWNSRAVIVQGVRYVSVDAAKRALRVGYAKLHRWLDTGEATYE